MPSYTYTDQIVLALSRHGTLNVSQLATKISHDHGKTKHIVNLMASNNKIQKAGALDGEPSYQLTSLGRSLAERLLSADSQPTHVSKSVPSSSPQRITEPTPTLALAPTPAPAPASTPTPASRTKPSPVPVAKPPINQISPNRTPDNTFGSDLGASECRFGILNSGQLIFLPQRVGPIVLSTADVEQLRRMLEAAA
jgi:hypothetical protein